MQWIILQQKQPEDYVIATGIQHNEKGYNQSGQCIVAVDPRYYRRPNEVETLLEDPSKAE